MHAQGRKRIRAAFLSRRSYALVLAGLLGLGAGGLCAAQEEGAAPPPRREHPELAFARSVGFGYRWYDIAYEVLDGLEKMRPGKDVVDEVTQVRLDLKSEQAATIKDPKQREEIMGQVRREYEKLAATPGPKQIDAQLRLGGLLMTEGSGAALRSRQAIDDAEERARARKEAEEKFVAAEQYFEKLMDPLRKRMEEVSDKPDKLPEAVAKLCVACFEHARALYEQAMLYEKGKDRETRLGKAAGAFEEVNMEFGDQFQGYEAAIFMGLAYKELGNLKRADSAFGAALAIKDYFMTEDGKYKLPPEAHDVVARASYFRAQALNEDNKFDEALKVVKELFELAPELLKSPLGYATRVEEGYAWGRKDMKRGQAILEKVMEDDKGGPWAASAKERLGQLMGVGGGGTVEPGKAISSAKTTMDRGKVPEGLAGLRFLIAQLEATSDAELQKKWLPLAWFELGMAYNGLKRYDEAAACFEALVARTKDKDLSPRALFQEAMANLQLNGARKNEYDKQNYTETLKKLQQNFPESEEAKASGVFLGFDRFAERDYAAAAKEFEKTSPSAKKMYDVALYQAALSYYLEGGRLGSDKEGKKDEKASKDAFSQAILSFKKAIDWATEGAKKAGVPEEGERGSALKKIAFDGRCRLSEIYLHPVMASGDATKKALEEARAAEAAAGEDKDRVHEARLLMVRAHIQAEDVGAAESVAASMDETSPKTAQAERLIATKVDADGEKAVKDGKKDEAKALFMKAGDHFTRWLAIAEKAELAISAREMTTTANRLFIQAQAINGVPDNKPSFNDVEDLTKLEAPARYQAAAQAYLQAAAAGATDYKTKINMGNALGFAGKWTDAAKALLEACVMEKLLKAEKEKDEKGKDITIISVDVALATKKPELIYAYADYGRCCFELMTTERKLIVETREVMGRVLGAASAGSDVWWRAKYYLFAALYEEGDYDSASIGLQQLKRQNPTFDNGKYGMRPRFEALLARLEGKKGKPGGQGGKK